MKFLITVSLAVFSIGAFAQQDLNSMKQEATSKIDRKLSSLQEARSCVNNASSVEKFKACKYDMHEDMKMQKMESKQDKKMKQEPKVEESDIETMEE